MGEVGSPVTGGSETISEKWTRQTSDQVPMEESEDYQTLARCRGGIQRAQTVVVRVAVTVGGQRREGDVG